MVFYFRLRGKAPRRPRPFRRKRLHLALPRHVEGPLVWGVEVLAAQGAREVVRVEVVLTHPGVLLGEILITILNLSMTCRVQYPYSIWK